MPETPKEWVQRKLKRHEELTTRLKELSVSDPEWSDIHQELKNIDFWCPKDDYPLSDCWQIARCRNVATVPLERLDHAGSKPLKSSCEDWALASLDSGPWFYADVVPIRITEGFWTTRLSKAGISGEDILHDFPWPVPIDA
jgi:hypothetical protein